MNKNNEQKNRKIIRLQTWDYRWAGAYFITICTQNREHYFGKIQNDKMQLSHIGVIADILWYEITNRAKNVELGEFVVMPNHIHGILILNGDDDTDKGSDNVDNVGTGYALSLPQHDQQTIGQQRFQNIGKNSISSIVGGYKSAVTKHANRLGFDFAWQVRFHDHIIRDEKSFNFISQYIINNPEKWEDDKFYSKKS
jgi:putative transposase